MDKELALHLQAPFFSKPYAEIFAIVHFFPPPVVL